MRKLRNQGDENNKQVNGWIDRIQSTNKGALLSSHDGTGASFELPGANITPNVWKIFISLFLPSSPSEVQLPVLSPPSYFSSFNFHCHISEPVSFLQYKSLLMKISHPYSLFLRFFSSSCLPSPLIFTSPCPIPSLDIIKWLKWQTAFPSLSKPLIFFYLCLFFPLFFLTSCPNLFFFTFLAPVSPPFSNIM